ARAPARRSRARRRRRRRWRSSRTFLRSYSPSNDPGDLLGGLTTSENGRKTCRFSGVLIPCADDGIVVGGARRVGKGYDAMIDGLRLTMAGGEVRRVLEERIDNHRRRAAWWKQQQMRAPEEEHDEAVPKEICENEAERHRWRADVLTFIRDR